VYFIYCIYCIGDSSNADVKERTSPSKKDSSMDNIVTKLLSHLDDDSDLGMRNISGYVKLFFSQVNRFFTTAAQLYSS